MKTVTETMHEFETLFDKKYVDNWKNAIENNKRVDLFIYLNSENMPVAQNKRIAQREIVCHIYFDPYEFQTQHLTLNELISYLTDEEKTRYIQVQNRFLENDDYLFYNMSELMIEWIKQNAHHAIEEYVDRRIIDRRIAFKNSSVWTMIVEQVETQAKQNLNSVYGASAVKKRDILGELENERDELCDKIKKLNTFIKGSEIYKTLPAIEQSSMKRQLTAMEKYAEELRVRIESISKRSN